MVDCAIHSIVSAAVDIGIVIFRQSSHSDVLLTPTAIPLIPTLFFPFFCLSSLHPFSLLNVFIMLWHYWKGHKDVQVGNNLFKAIRGK